ncbi:trypsin-like serine peptidase [Streptomyces sirii]|uniref:trypsin-like serine peptidase n=1 Tax=Streptomyces sirii TaxID=3127701 RepID=UPI003D3686A4
MASATPEDAKTTTAAEGLSPPAGEQAKGNTGIFFGGVPTVGMIFGLSKGMKAHYCSASVVDSPGKNVILTAGHCSFGDNAAFVPKYSGKAKNKTPYGIFAVQSWFRDSRYHKMGEHADKGPYSDLDFAFARVKKGKGGKNVQQATKAALKLGRINGDYIQNVTVVGYPGGAHNSENDDVVVRWSDGETTLYADTATRLGRERMLVPPKVK